MDKRTCPECRGEGVVYIEEQYIAVFCPRCRGKGYVEEEKVGDTISYSSGKVADGDSLVRGAREASEANLQRLVMHREAYGENVRVRATELELVLKRALCLCDALEERGREVERLREQVTRLDAYITHRDYDREILDENTRLREELRVTRMERDHAWEN